MVAENSELSKDSEDTKVSKVSKVSKDSEDSEDFELTFSEDSKYSKWQIFLAKFQFSALLKVSSQKFWKKALQSPQFFYHLAKNFQIPRDIRISDWMEDQIEPYFNQILDQIERVKFQECTASVNSMVSLERIASKAPEILARVQRAHRDGQWDIMNALWTNFNPASLSLESVNRQLLYGQRFLAKNFHMQGSMIWLHQINQIPPEIIPILTNSGISQILLTTENNRTLPYPLHFHWGFKEALKLDVQIVPILNKIRKTLRFYANLPDSFSSDSPFILFYNDSSKNHGKLASDWQIFQKQILEHRNLIQNSSFDNTWESKPSKDFHLLNVSGTLNFPSPRVEQNILTFIQLYHQLACNLFHETEMLSLFSGLLGSPHLQPEITDLWKILLEVQDHRLFTGQLITEIYRDVCRDYQSLIASLQSVQENSLMHIAHALKSTLKNDLYTIFNPLAWNRHGYFLIPARSFGAVLDHSDNPLFIQRVNHSHFIPNSELQLGLCQIDEIEYLQNNERKIQEIEELEGMNLNFNSEGLKSSLKSVHDKLMDYENQSSELLLVYLPPNAGLKSFGIANISCVKVIPPPPRDYPNLKKTPEYYFFSNRQIYAKISRTTGLLEFLGSSPNSPNILGELGINYTIHRHKHGLQHFFHKQQSSIGDMLQKKNPVRIEIEEEGPLRFTFISKFGPFADGTEIHTRYSFFHKSSRITVQTIVNWQTPNAQLDVEIPFNQRIDRIHVKNSYGFSTEVFSPSYSHGGSNTANLDESDDRLDEKSVVGSELILLENSNSTEKHNEESSHSTVAFYGQISHPIQISSRRVHFSLLRSTPVSRADMDNATLDVDHENQYSNHEIGFHIFNWVLEPFLQEKSSLEIYKTSQEIRFPLLAVPTNAKHDHESFLKISPAHVEVLAVKEIEEFMQEAPEWFYQPTMAELPFVIRCREVLGESANVEIILSPKFDIKKVLEVDVLEHVSQPNIVPEHLEHKDNCVCFSLKPHQMKTIMFIAKIPLEEE